MSDLRHEIARRVPLGIRMGGRRLFYWGSSETCDFCGSSVRTYLTNGSDIPVLSRRGVVGGMARPSDRCPVCHAQDRTRLLRFYLERRHADLGSGLSTLRVLNVAPDLGLVLWMQALRGVAYTGTDIDGARYRHVARFVVADLTDLPFDEGSFDVVICSHVLEHVPDDRAAMRELHRVLVPSGEALLLVPLSTDGGGMDEDPTIVSPTERERRFGQWDHVRLYDRGSFDMRLGSAGFEVSVFDPFGCDAAEAAARKLNPLELLTVATRVEQEWVGSSGG